MVNSKWTHESSTYNMLLAISAGFCLANCTFGNPETLYNTTILSVDHRFRPTSNLSKPTTVSLSLDLLSLVDVEEVQQRMSINVLLTVSWLDELRQWNSSIHGGVNKVHPDPLDVWRPRLFLTNSLMKRDVFEDNYAPLTIYNNGHTEWLPGGILDLSCSMQMAYFPFDTQICSLSFTSGESCDSVQLVADSNISEGHYDKNGEWLIRTYQVLSQCTKGRSSVRFSLKLNRMPSFTLLNIVIPINIISSLCSLVFVMPVGSGERVSFSITVLLSLTVYTSEVSKELPTNSESIPLLIMYLASLLLHAALCIVANLIVLIQSYHGSGSVSRKQQSNQTADIAFTCAFAEDRSVLPTVNENGVRLLKLRKTTFDIDDQKSTNNPPLIDSPFVKCRKFKTHFESLLVKLGDYTKCISNNREESEKMNLLKALVSSLLSYIRVVDIILFILFFGVWLVITLTFMTLMAYGDKHLIAK